MQNNKNKIIICFGIIITIIIITIIGICYFVFNNKPVQQSKSKLKSKPKLEPNFEEPIIEDQKSQKEQQITQLMEKSELLSQEWSLKHAEQMKAWQESKDFHETHQKGLFDYDFQCLKPECVSWREKTEKIKKEKWEVDDQKCAIDQQIAQLQDQDQQ